MCYHGDLSKRWLCTGGLFIALNRPMKNFLHVMSKARLHKHLSEVSETKSTDLLGVIMLYPFWLQSLEGSLWVFTKAARRRRERKNAIVHRVRDCAGRCQCFIVWVHHRHECPQQHLPFPCKDFLPCTARPRPWPLERVKWNMFYHTHSEAFNSQTGLWLTPLFPRKLQQIKHST